MYTISWKAALTSISSTPLERIDDAFMYVPVGKARPDGSIEVVVFSDDLPEDAADSEARYKVPAHVEATAFIGYVEEQEPGQFLFFDG